MGYAGLLHVVGLRVVPPVVIQGVDPVRMFSAPRAIVVKAQTRIYSSVSLIRFAATVWLSQVNYATAERVVIRIVHSLHRLPLAAIQRATLVIPRTPVMDRGRVYPTLLLRAPNAEMEVPVAERASA